MDGFLCGVAILATGICVVPFALVVVRWIVEKGNWEILGLLFTLFGCNWNTRVIMDFDRSQGRPITIERCCGTSGIWVSHSRCRIRVETTP